MVSVGEAVTDETGGGDGAIETWTASDLVDDVQEGDKRFGQTGSPTRVLAVRDVTPERAGLFHTDAGEARAAIEALLAERPPPETSWDKPDNIAEKPAAHYDSWTLVELDRGQPTRHSLELLARGRALAGKLGGRNVALVLGHEIGEVPQELGRRGAEVVVVVDDEQLGSYQPEIWAGALGQVVERERPHLLLIPASAFGRDLGPRVAGDLELGMTGDCVAVDIAKAGRLLQTKPAYGGNIVSVIMGRTTPQFATVRARMYEPLELRDEEAEVRSFELESLPAQSARLVEQRHDERTGLDLDAADVVVFAGPQANLEELDGVACRRLPSGSAATPADRPLRPAGCAAPSHRRRSRRNAGGAGRLRQGGGRGGGRLRGGRVGGRHLRRRLARLSYRAPWLPRRDS